MMCPKLVRWETPFTDTQFPSAVIVAEDGPSGEYLISALVAPSGIDKYPKFRVHFGVVIAFSCMEEMQYPARDWDQTVEVQEKGLAAYEYLNSTWLISYEKGEYFLFNTDGGNSERLRHYLINGGDFIIEVITKHKPTFETISSATDLLIKVSL
jgi:hypothetical protein